MKKTLLVILLLSSALFVSAQDKLTYENYMKRPDELPKFSIGVGTGINNFTALIGPSVNFRVVKLLSLQGGLGLGGWGYKVSGGLILNTSYKGGLYFGAGYSYSPGENNLQMSLPLQSGTTQTVHLDYLAAGTINLKAGYSFRMGKVNTFYLECGYAIPMQATAWKVTDGSALASAATETLNILQPGGIILGLGFTFGFRDN
jgi:hypothetical protein